MKYNKHDFENTSELPHCCTNVPDVRGRGLGFLTSQGSLQAHDVMKHQLFWIPAAPATTKGGPLLSILMWLYVPLENKEMKTSRSLSLPWKLSIPPWPEPSQRDRSPPAREGGQCWMSPHRCLSFVLPGGLLPPFTGPVPPIWLTPQLLPHSEDAFSICCFGCASEFSSKPSATLYHCSHAWETMWLPRGKDCSRWAYSESLRHLPAHFCFL